MESNAQKLLEQRKFFRGLAYRADADCMRNAALKMLESDPTRSVSSDAIKLNAYIVECDFVSAAGLVQSIRIKYDNDIRKLFIDRVTEFAEIYINFGQGNITEAIRKSQNYLSIEDNMIDIDEVDLLALLRMQAQGHLVLQENSKLKKVLEQAESIKSVHNTVEGMYVLNAIKSIYLYAIGEITEALVIAEKNIGIATQNKFAGIYGPMDMKLVAASCYFEMNLIHKSIEYLEDLISEAKTKKILIWQLVGLKLVTMESALRSDFKSALQTIRIMREMLADRVIQNDLAEIADLAESTVRMLLGDADRLETLLNRVLTNEAKPLMLATLKHLKGEDVSEIAQLLPNSTLREALTKYIFLSKVHLDSDSVCRNYLNKAIKISEATGMKSSYFIDQQIARKVISSLGEKPNRFLENLISDLIDFVRRQDSILTHNQIERLTNREIQIVKILATKDTIAQIGVHLHLSMNTMKTHLRNIYRKLGVQNRESAVKVAKENLLI